MSEIATTPTGFSEWRAGNSPLPPWRNLRLLIAPALPHELVVSLVMYPMRGHPVMHPQVRQLRQTWFPEQHPGELEEYALRVAFLRVSQTRF
jgi:hypothetical protein